MFSNTGVVPTGTNIQTGNIEFWGWQYIAVTALVCRMPRGRVRYRRRAWSRARLVRNAIHDHAANRKRFWRTTAGRGGNSDVGIGNRRGDERRAPPMA